MKKIMLVIILITLLISTAVIPLSTAEKSTNKPKYSDHAVAPIAYAKGIVYMPNSENFDQKLTKNNDIIEEETWYYDAYVLVSGRARTIYSTGDTWVNNGNIYSRWIGEIGQAGICIGGSKGQPEGEEELLIKIFDQSGCKTFKKHNYETYHFTIDVLNSKGFYFWAFNGIGVKKIPPTVYMFCHAEAVCLLDWWNVP